MISKTFATAVNCMDGRVQLPVIAWLKDRYSIDYVDMITEPGPERVLADGYAHASVGSIRQRIELSIGCHHSKLVAIVGHHDCAGNPADQNGKYYQIAAAIERIKSWSLNTPVIGLCIDENWEVHEVPSGLQLAELELSFSHLQC
jgi:hypothetical protein